MDERVKEAIEAIESDIIFTQNTHQETVIVHLSHAKLLLSRVRELEEGIEKHRNGRASMDLNPGIFDEDLYKLLERKEG